MMRLNSLRKRFYILLLLPIALLLIAFGYLGYFQFRQILFNEWQATAMVKLEHAALELELRLDNYRQWFKLFNLAGLSAQSGQIQPWILQQLRQQEGVEGVHLSRQEPQSPTLRQRLVDRTAAKSLSLSRPRFLADRASKTVTLQSKLLDRKGEPAGQLAVVLNWPRLLQGLFSSGWFQAHDTIIIDENNHFLYHSNPLLQDRQILGEGHDPLELAVLQSLAKQSAAMLQEPGGTPGMVVGYYRLPQTPWTLLLFARQDLILAPIQRFRFYYLTAGVFCLFAILALLRQLICPIIMSIREISRATLQVAEGHYGQPLPEDRRDELGQLTHNFNIMVEGLKERDYIKDTFGRYVDPEVARALLSRPEAARLGGERRFVTILFADLRDFTAVAEAMSPEATISLVNRFFSQMVEVIRHYQGIIVDFYGDGLLAFFEPFPEEDLGQCVDRGRRCALEMQAAMEELNFTGERLGFPALRLGVGVHAGEAVVGNIGSQTRAKYGVVGSAVNLTHRLQGKAGAGEVILSAAAYARIQPQPPVQRTFQAELKGLREPMTLYVLQPEGSGPESAKHPACGAVGGC
ncbi:MAG: adenylate/guanylate cyclase domain-containing protein [Desulfobacca sp.]|uniref:adenylate/guanylate cyclase domain-containing protein n=1 Tax=Desulfobacca sp. TaxID=2067990 RepID=UPI00404B025C